MSDRLRGKRLVMVLVLMLTACTASTVQRPNVLIVVLDTLRADRVSCYGYDRPTTPHIDALCARGVRFEHAYSTSTWTLPAHASLFTGLFPIRHGATQENVRLGGGPSTLAEILGANGYETFGVSDNPLVGPQTGLDRGFDDFVETWRNASTRDSDPYRHPNLEAVARFLADLDPDQPFFAFANYIEIHGPYAPPEPHRSRFLAPDTDPALMQSALRRDAAGFYLDSSSIAAPEFAVLNDLYDGEVARVDALVGALVDTLERSGHADDTLLVITSDHGENIGDHGHFRHVFSLYGTTVRIPLILVLPGGLRGGEVRSEPVGLVDVFATVLRQCGIEPTSRAFSAAETGRDILADPVESPIFAEYYYPLQALGLFSPDAFETHREVLDPYLHRLRSVQEGGWRFVWSSRGRHALFDLTRDPEEQRNLAGMPESSETELRLRGLLDGFVERAGGGPPLAADVRANPKGPAVFDDLDSESARRLRELGYIR